MEAHIVKGGETLNITLFYLSIKVLILFKCFMGGTWVTYRSGGLLGYYQ